jgi:hypothetical protein
MFKKRNLMKKKLVLLCLLSTTSRIVANDAMSHTFFSIQPLFHAALSTKISLFYERNLMRENGIKTAIQVVPFYSQSLNEPGIAKFFLPFNKTSIVAGEFNSQAVLNNTVDVMANYFGVLTQPVDTVYAGDMGLQTTNLTFQSLIRFKPVQKVFGIGLSYKQKISNMEDDCKGWFVHLSSPIMKVTNDLGYSESVINEGGGEVPEGYVGTVGDALSGQTVFGNSKFEYGKISPCGGLTRWGLGDIECGVGFETIFCDHFHGMWAGGIVIPTGNKPKGEFIFEPIVGNNGHFGLIYYGEYSYQVWQNPAQSKSIWFHLNGFSQYLFGNLQHRSFDLLDKQWSRYMWVYRTDVSPATVSPEYQMPGINVFTQPVHVWPRSSFNANNSFVFKTNGFVAEAGYSTYYRQEEEVKLACPWPDNVYIVGIDQTNTTVFVTESNATMRRFLNTQGINFDTDPNNPAEPNIIAVSENDLDLRSAAHPCTISHALWGSLGYQWNDICIPTLISGGGSYEFSSENLALHRWTVWAKAMLSF